MRKMCALLTVWLMMTSLLVAGMTMGTLNIKEERYVLGRGATPNNDSEPNNDFNNATLVTSGAIFSGGVGGGDIYDYFKIMLSTGVNADKLNVTVTMNLGVTAMRIYDPFRTEIARDDSMGNIMSLNITAAYTGYYYIRFEDMGPSNYTISINVTQVSFTNDGDNDWDNATEVSSFPYTRSSSIHHEDDPVDYYSINMTKDVLKTDLLKVIVVPSENWDCILSIYKRGSTDPIDEVNRFGHGKNETLLYTAAEAGYVYVRVWAIKGSGSYTIIIKKHTSEQDGNDNIENAEALQKVSPHNYEVEGSVAFGADMIDFYVIELDENESINCTLKSRDYDPTDDSPVIIIALYDAEQNEIPPKPSDNRADPIAYQEYTASQYGSCYISIRSLKWGGAYNLNITCNKQPIVETRIEKIEIPENGENTSIKLNNVFSDPDGDELSFTYELYGPLIGNMTVTIGTDEDATVTLKPKEGWSGEGKIKFYAIDTFGKNASLESQVIVIRANHPPRLVGPSNAGEIRIPKNKIDMTSLNLSHYFTDDDPGDHLWYNVSGNVHINVAFQLDPATNIYHTGGVTLRPEEDWIGNETLTFRATDDGGLKADGEVTVTVIVEEVEIEHYINVKYTPKVYVKEDSVNESLNLNDVFEIVNAPKGDNLNFSVSNAGSGRILVKIAENGTVSFKPQPDWYGIDVIEFKAKCIHGYVAFANITVEVISVNDPPEIAEYQPLTKEIIVNEGGEVRFIINATDIETPSSLLTYKWFLDEKDVHSALRGWTYKPNYDESGRHVVKVVVSDGEDNTSMEWNVTVVNVNRKPQVKIVEPMNDTKFIEGKKIKFRCEANDADGDILNITWYANDKKIGESEVFNYSKLSPGKYKIRVVVSDGNDTTEDVVYIKVEKKRNGPGFEIVILIISTILIVGMKKIKKFRK